MQAAAQKFDIVIVGGGMVGASLAVCLGQCEHTRSLSIALLEASGTAPEFHCDSFDPRVVAISKTSQQFLQDLGVWNGVVRNRACPYVAMDVWDAEGTGSIQFHARENHADNLGHIVENSNLASILSAKLAELPNICVLQDCKVERFTEAQGELPTQLMIQHRGVPGALHASLVIAADGARSQLREWAGLDTREWDYGHTAIVTTVTTERSHQNTCWQRFTADGPIALLPLREKSGAHPEDGHHCSLVWSADQSLAETLMAMADKDFCRALTRAFESRLGVVTHADERFAIALRQRHAKHYFKPGIALVGDAAHTIHPLAGQGVNLGFYDVVALCREIDRACARGIALSDTSLLRRYQRERQGHNLSAMLAMEAFKRLFEAQQPALRWLRNTGMSFVNHQLFLKTQLSKIAAGQH